MARHEAVKRNSTE